MFQANAFQNNVSGAIKGFQVETVTPPLVPAAGGGYALHFSRRRWRELLELLEAEERAELDISGNKKPAQQEAIAQAREAANRALIALQEAAETAALNAQITRLTNALNGAVGASRVTASIKHAKIAMIAAESIARQVRDEQEEEEDMQAILLTLH